MVKNELKREKESLLACRLEDVAQEIGQPRQLNADHEEIGNNKRACQHVD
jgi:hypothetical protein